MKYIIFRNDETKYALDITVIKRIIKEQRLTKIPLSAPSSLGVTNVMGELISVHDFGFIMSGKYIEEKVDNHILLLQDKKIGFLVEEVETITDINDEDIKETYFGEDKKLLAKVGENIIVVLNITDVLLKTK